MCSNPSKYPEYLRKASTQKYRCLREFCKLQKAPAKYRAAFARRRSGFRLPSAPLQKFGNLQVKRGASVEATDLIRGLVLHNAFSKALVTSGCRGGGVGPSCALRSSAWIDRRHREHCWVARGPLLVARRDPPPPS